MKILFIITRADTVGGAQIHVKDLAIALKKRGDHVLIVTGIQGYYNDYLKQLNIETLACEYLQQKINPIKDIKSLIYLKNIIKDFQPHLVTTHSSKAGILGRLASKINHIPCIFTAHGWAFTEGIPQPHRTLYLGLEKLVEPLADKIICVSEYDHQLAIKVGMNPPQLFTIHNSVPELSDRFLANPDIGEPISIVMIARFDQQKDHLTLLKACENLDNIKLILVGDGPKLTTIQTLVKESRLNQKVEFLGYSNDIASILARANIFVLTSHWEGLPLTILEAMRAGLPIIATKVGGIPETIEEGITGYCIPKGDFNLLQERLITLINNPQLRREMGKKARRKYELEFSFSLMIEKTVNVYQTVLNKVEKI